MSKYTDLVKESLTRVAELTDDYATALSQRDHELAGVLRSQIGAARAYAQGLADAQEALSNDS